MVAVIDQDADKPELIDRLKPFFRNKILEPFQRRGEFSHPGKEDLSKIVDLMLVEVNKTLAKKTSTDGERCCQRIHDEGYDEVMGVHPLRRG